MAYDPDNTIQLTIAFKPHYLVYLQKLARLGKATNYGDMNRIDSILQRYVKFNFAAAPELKKNWPELDDVETLVILYGPALGRERRVTL